MISPERLRRFPFFGKFNDAQLRSLAMITVEIDYPSGTILFEEGKPASSLYLLIDGGVDLTFKSEEKFHPKTSKIFQLGEINPGEVFGISAVIEPNIYTATSTAAKDCLVLQIDSKALQAIIESDIDFGYILIRQIAKTALERLATTRVQLAAAWA